MNEQLYILAFSTCGVLLIVGAVLLWMWHCLKLAQQDSMKKFIEKDLSRKMKEILLDTMSESMDIIPEKIQEVKRTIEEG